MQGNGGDEPTPGEVFDAGGKPGGAAGGKFRLRCTRAGAGQGRAGWAAGLGPPVRGLENRPTRARCDMQTRSFLCSNSQKNSQVAIKMQGTAIAMRGGMTLLTNGLKRWAQVLQVQSGKIKWRFPFIAAVSTCGLGHNNVHAPMRRQSPKCSDSPRPRGLQKKAWCFPPKPKIPPNGLFDIRGRHRRLWWAGVCDCLLVTCCMPYKLLSSQAMKSGPLSCS